MSRRNPDPKPKKRTLITIPERAGPHVKLIFAEMGRQRVTYDELAWRAGVLVATLKAWRHKNSPSLQNIEAVYGVLGFDLVAVPRADVLPPDLIKALAPVAELFGMTMTETIRAVVEIVAGVHADVGAPLPPRMKRERRAEPKRGRYLNHVDQRSIFEVLQ